MPMSVKHLFKNSNNNDTQLYEVTGRLLTDLYGVNENPKRVIRVKIQPASENKLTPAVGRYE
jgi:hypothetical protein